MDEDNGNCTTSQRKDSAVQSDPCREVNYIFMRMQGLKKADGQKITKLLAVVNSYSCITYSDQQATFSGCFESMGQIYPSGK